MRDRRNNVDHHQCRFRDGRGVSQGTANHSSCHVHDTLPSSYLSGMNIVLSVVSPNDIELICRRERIIRCLIGSGSNGGSITNCRSPALGTCLQESTKIRKSCWQCRPTGLLAYTPLLMIHTSNLQHCLNLQRRCTHSGCSKLPHVWPSCRPISPYHICTELHLCGAQRVPASIASDITAHDMRSSIVTSTVRIWNIPV